MSFKVFMLQLSGKLNPVKKIEVQREMLYNHYLEYLRVDDSEELSEFLELEKCIHSIDFKKRKAEIQELQFKGSKEYNQLKEFEKLKNFKPIKNYFKIKDSEDFNRYLALKDSEKIEEYRSLLDFMEGGEYKKVKEEIKLQTYKGSSEEKRLAEFNKMKRMPGIRTYFELHGSDVLLWHNAFYQSPKLKQFFDLNNLPDKDKVKKRELKILKGDSEIRTYLRFEHSKKLKLYHETVDSYQLKRFDELKQIVESENFKKHVNYLQDKKKFEKTEAYRKGTRLKELTASEDVKFFLKFEKSALLRNYYDVKDSMELKRYMELKEIVNSESFHQRREYLEDHRKWEKTEEYAKECRFLELKQMPHLVNYFKYKGTNAFDFFNTWDLSFEETFSAGHLDQGKWSTLPFWSEKLLGRNYSLPGDLHNFTDGENIKTGGKLVIEIRKEKRKGMLWQMPAGFVPAEFDYSSGLISSAKSFWQEDGIFEAKIKFHPVKEVVSTFILLGENQLPRIHLLEMGAKNRIGIATDTGKGSPGIEGLDISNLKKDKWYIFTLEKAGDKITWKINDTVVLVLNHRKIFSPLHMNLLSIVVNPVPGSKLPVRFETDWIRCYKRR
jgi:hypothetical protein